MTDGKIYLSPQSHRARRLNRIASAISRRAHTLVRPSADEADRELADVAFAYLRGMVVQAGAIVLLADSGIAQASYSNLRSLFEIYVDFRFLLLGDDREAKARKARRIRLYAIRDMRESLAKIGSPPDSIERLENHERRVGDLDPELYAQFEGEWSKSRKPGHWSGMGRTQVVRTLDPDPEGMLLRYKIYSWESHGVLSALLDVDISTPGVTRYEYPHNQEKVAGLVCDQAARYLLDAWRGIRHHGWWQPSART